MQYFLLPAALVTASGMLANAAPLNGVNKDAADLQPLAAPATNAGEPLVVQWKPAAKNSAWKHMDVSLVALLANGKQHETSLAHGIDGTDPTNNTLHAKAPKHVHGDSTQYLIKFSDGQDEKKSPKFVIRENKDSKLHSRRNSGSGISKEQIDSIIQEMLGSGERDSDDSGSSTGHGSPTAAINRIPSAASSSLVSKASSKHKPITISGVTYYPKIDSTRKSKSKSKSGKKSSKSTSATSTPDSRDAWSDMAQQMEANEKHSNKSSSSTNSSEHGRNAAAAKIPTASPSSSTSSSKKHGHSKSSSSSHKKHNGHHSHGHHGGQHGHSGKSHSSETKKHQHSSKSQSAETSSSPSSSADASQGRSAVQQQGGGKTGGELQVDTPAFASQCRPLRITWHGGKAPYTPYITAEGDVGNVLDSLEQTQDTTASWKVTVPEGQKFTINMCDADGVCRPSGPVGPVSKGPDSCINGGGAPPKKRFAKREESRTSRQRVRRPRLSVTARTSRRTSHLLLRPRLRARIRLFFARCFIIHLRWAAQRRMLRAPRHFSWEWTPWPVSARCSSTVAVMLVRRHHALPVAQ